MLLLTSDFLYHSHLRKVDEVILSVVGCSFFYEGQVGQVHSQVGNTGRVTAEEKAFRVIKSHQYNQADNNVWLLENNQAHFFRASLKFLNRPSDETSFCILSMTVFVWKKKGQRGGEFRGVQGPSQLTDSGIRIKHTYTCTWKFWYQIPTCWFVWNSRHG